MLKDATSVQSWVTFAGAVLVVAVLSWARDLLMPIALAALLTFMLARPVGALQRWIGRTPAVLVTVSLVFALLGVALWGLGSQFSLLVDDLPQYRTNIREKIGDVRQVGNGSVQKLQKTLDEIKGEIAPAPQARGRRPLRSCGPNLSACGISLRGSVLSWARSPRPVSWSSW